MRNSSGFAEPMRYPDYWGPHRRFCLELAAAGWPREMPGGSGSPAPRPGTPARTGAWMPPCARYIVRNPSAWRITGGCLGISITHRPETPLKSDAHRIRRHGTTPASQPISREIPGKPLVSGSGSRKSWRLRTLSFSPILWVDHLSLNHSDRSKTSAAF